MRPKWLTVALVSLVVACPAVCAAGPVVHHHAGQPPPENPTSRGCDGPCPSTPCFCDGHYVTSSPTVRHVDLSLTDCGLIAVPGERVPDAQVLAIATVERSANDPPARFDLPLLI